MKAISKGTINLLPVIILFSIMPVFINDPYNLTILILFLMWVIVAMFWNLLLGYAGIFSIGQFVFFAAGGYTSAKLVATLNVSPWIGLVAGGGVAVIVSLIVGLPTLRLRGIYVAMMTLAFQEVLRNTLLLSQLQEWTGGSAGIYGLPPLEIGTLTTLNKLGAYYIALIFFIVSLISMYLVVNSRIGLTFTAIRDSDTASAAIGINIYKYKMYTFMISAFFTGIIGAYYSNYIRVISPIVLSFSYILMIVVMIVIGGIGNFHGPIIGAFIITLMMEHLKIIGFWRFVIIGIVVITTLMFAPQGLAKTYSPLINRVKSKFSAKAA